MAPRRASTEFAGDDAVPPAVSQPARSLGSRLSQPAQPVAARRLIMPGEAGLGLALLLGCLAAWPFLTRPGLPLFTDSEQHIYRTYEILSAWRAGELYVRWAPDLYHGFGYPVFNYYAPLTYYLGALYGLAFGSGGAVAGVKFVYVAAALIGALGTYLFVREGCTPPSSQGVRAGLGGVVAAAAFAFTPYVAAAEPHTLGRAPETFAVALTPLLFWTFARLRRSPSAGGVWLAGLALATVLLSHNLLAPLTLALLFAWLVATWRPEPHARAAKALGAALLLGLGLVAFFWVPAILERGAVQLDNATAAAFVDYRTQFVRLSDLLRPAAASDVTDLSTLQVRLGLPQWLLALLGILGMFGDGQRRRETLFFSAAALGLLFFILPASRPVWDNVKVLALVQFPWRLLGPLSFVIAVLAGMGVQTVEAAGHHIRADRFNPRGHMAAQHLSVKGAGQIHRHQHVTTLGFSALAVAGCLAAGLPLLQPLPWADFGPVTVQRVLKAEFDWEVGTTPTNEFLPTAVKVPPAAQAALLESYAAGSVDKVNHAALPGGTRVDVLGHGPDYDRMTVHSGMDFVLRVFTFDFPGWTAYVDGGRVPIAPSEPEGWITLNVPAGDHTVLLRFEDTAPRRVGWAISGLAALTGLAVAAWWRRRRSVTTDRNHGRPLPRRPALALGAVIVGGLCLNLVAQQQGWWAARLASTRESPSVAVPAKFQANIALLGYDLPSHSAHAGDQVPVILYWTALAPVTDNLRVFVHFVGPDGQLWANSDKFHPGEFHDFPTSRWPVGYRLKDAHLAAISPQAPPGVYRVEAGLWNEFTGQRSAVLDVSGAPTMVDAALLTGAFQVER